MRSASVLLPIQHPIYRGKKMVSTFFTILPVLLSAICCSASSDHGPNSRSRTNTHRDLAKRIGIQVGDLGLLNDVKNLITKARFTFYDVGL